MTTGWFGSGERLGISRNKKLFRRELFLKKRSEKTEIDRPKGGKDEKENRNFFRNSTNFRNSNLDFDSC